MKKAITILHTVYIAAISAMLVLSAARGSFRQIFTSGGWYALHTAVGLALAALGIAIGVAHFRRPHLVNKLQILWWLPQLIQIVSTRFTPEGQCYIVNSFWHWPLGPVIAPQLGWKLDPQVYLLIKFNLVALVGIAIGAVTRSKLRAQQTQATSETAPSAASETSDA